MNRTIFISVAGKVQGVFYRQSCREKALQLGITGSVKNEANGTVTIYATGSAEQLEELLNWCSQGPSRAIVQKVTSHTIPFCEFTGFSIDKR